MLLSRPRLVRRVLPAEDARSLLGSGDGADEAGLARTLPPQHALALASTFSEMQRIGREPFSLHNANIGYLLARAFSAFSAADALPVWSALHPAVAAAVRLLRAPEGNLARGALARRCGASEWHLSKLFHQQIGVSLVDFRNRCRLERFLELYDGGRVKLSTAALEAGFGSYPQFHRVFRARMGHAPSTLARRARTG
jgi:AraC-like DNA-binding protein